MGKAIPGEPQIPAPHSRIGRPPGSITTLLGTHILEVAIEQFFLRGYEATSMDAVAAAAQVSKRTLYQRFGSKRGLLLAIREQERCYFAALVDTPLPDGDVRTKVAFLANILVEATTTPRALALAGLREELRRLEPDLEDGTYQRLVDHWVSAFQSILCTDAGLSRTAPEQLDFISAFLFDALVTLPQRRLLRQGDLSNTAEGKMAFIDATLDLLARGVPALRASSADDPTMLLGARRRQPATHGKMPHAR